MAAMPSHSASNSRGGAIVLSVGFSDPCISTVADWLQHCRTLAAKGRYRRFFDSPQACLRASIWGSLATPSAVIERPAGRAPCFSRGEEGERAVSISPYLDAEVFDQEVTRAMGVAFEHACETLRLSDKDDPATRLLAKKVIEAASSGERDAERLYQMALENVRRPPVPVRRDDVA